MSTIFGILFWIFLILTLVFAGLAVLFFFLFRIPELYGSLSGKTAEREIAAMKAQNAASSQLAEPAVPGMNGLPRGSAVRRNAPAKPLPTLSYDETKPLPADRQKAIFEKMQERTGVFPTENLAAQEGGSEEPTRSLRTENLKIINRDAETPREALKENDYGVTTVLNTRLDDSEATTVLLNRKTGRGSDGFDGVTEVLNQGPEDVGYAETSLLSAAPVYTAETEVLGRTEQLIARTIEDYEAVSEAITENLAPVRFDIIEEIILIHSDEIL